MSEGSNQNEVVNTYDDGIALTSGDGQRRNGQGFVVDRISGDDLESKIR